MWQRVGYGALVWLALVELSAAQAADLRMWQRQPSDWTGVTLSESSAGPERLHSPRQCTR